MLCDIIISDSILMYYIYVVGCTYGSVVSNHKFHAHDFHHFLVAANEVAGEEEVGTRMNNVWKVV